MTYQVFTKDGFPLAICPTLDTAIAKAKALGQFVRIVSAEGMEIVGKFGVDNVAEGRLPDGHVYEWNKANRIGRVKKERLT